MLYNDYMSRSRNTASLLGSASVILSDGTLSLPNLTDTVVGRNTSDILTNKTFQGVGEITTISSNSTTGTINFDILSQSILYHTSNSTGNWDLNVRGNSSNTLNSKLSVGNSITVVFLVTNGATPYYQTSFKIDGASHSPKWQGGSAPTEGNASSIDIYSFTIIKTSSSPGYITLASVVGFA
jgi:hypothetical protein